MSYRQHIVEISAGRADSTSLRFVSASLPLLAPATTIPADAPKRSAAPRMAGHERIRPEKPEGKAPLATPPAPQPGHVWRAAFARISSRNRQFIARKLAVVAA